MIGDGGPEEYFAKVTSKADQDLCNLLGVDRGERMPSTCIPNRSSGNDQNEK